MTHLFVTQIILSSNTKSCGGNDITHTTERLHNYNHKSLSAFTDEQIHQRRKDISVYPIITSNNFSFTVYASAIHINICCCFPYYFYLTRYSYCRNSIKSLDSSKTMSITFNTLIFSIG